MNFDTIIFSRAAQHHTITAVIHRHWWGLCLSGAGISFVGVMLPLFFLLTAPTLWVAWVVWMALGMVRVLARAMAWYCDAWVLTEHGLHVASWKGLGVVGHHVDYAEIHEVHEHRHGVMARALNFGEVALVLGHGEEAHHVHLEHAENPEGARHKILTTKARGAVEREHEQEKVVKEILEDIIRKQLEKRELEEHGDATAQGIGDIL